MLKSLFRIFGLIVLVVGFAAFSPILKADGMPEEVVDEGEPQLPPEGHANEHAEPHSEPRPDYNLQSCHEAFASANECCNNPLACMGVSGSTGQDIAAAVSIIGSFAAMGMGSMSPEDSQKMQMACQIMQAVGMAAGAVNGGGAVICRNKKNRCIEACGEIKSAMNEEREERQARCNALPEEERADAQDCQDDRGFEADYGIVDSRIHGCETFSLNVAAMGQQAAHSGTAAAMGQLCASLSGSQTETASLGQTPPDLTNVDCSDPANQYDPRCRDCSDPANASNPACRNPDNGDGNNRPPANVSTTASMGENPNAFNTFDLGDGNPSQQGPQFGASNRNQASTSKGVPNNGGGFAGGTGAGSFGGGGGSPASAAGGGYNTDVLQDARGGSGFSSNPGGGFVSASGGFSGYGGPERRTRSSFDLKQFLPGGKKDPTRRLAGMAGASMTEIGPSHIDIWTRMSNRVKEICKLNRLYDCGK